MDLAFIVDSSGSIGRKNWANMKTFLQDLIDEFKVANIGTHVATVTYSTDADVVFDFNDLQGSGISANGYKKLIGSMKWTRGYTFIDKGLTLANEKIFTTSNGMRSPSTPKVGKESLAIVT